MLHLKLIDAHPRVSTRAVRVYWELYGIDIYKYMIRYKIYINPDTAPPPPPILSWIFVNCNNAILPLENSLNLLDILIIHSNTQLSKLEMTGASQFIQV